MYWAELCDLVGLLLSEQLNGVRARGMPSGGVGCVARGLTFAHVCACVRVCGYALLWWVVWQLASIAFRSLLIGIRLLFTVAVTMVIVFGFAGFVFGSDELYW